MDPGDVVSACLAALEPGKTVCIPGLEDPTGIEHHHNTARQLMQASGHPQASRYSKARAPMKEPPNRPVPHPEPRGPQPHDPDQAGAAGLADWLSQWPALTRVIL